MGPVKKARTDDTGTRGREEEEAGRRRGEIRHNLRPAFGGSVHN